MPWRSILVFIVLFVVYVGAETGVSEWATTFFAGMGQGPFVGALATSLFFATFTTGRFTLASTTERLGYARTVRMAMAFGGVALLLLLFEPVAIVGLALAGIAFSVVFPTMVAWGARRHPEIRAQMVSLSIASAGAGGMTIPYAIGWGVQLIGTWSLPLMLVVTALTVSLVALFEPGVA